MRDNQDMSTRSTFRRRTARVLALAVLAAVSAASPFVRGEDSSADKDPFPIRRVVLSPERAAQEIERLGPGLLVQMPLSEFNGLVRRAARRAAEGDAAPGRRVLLGPA